MLAPSLRQYILWRCVKSTDAEDCSLTRHPIGLEESIIVPELLFSKFCFLLLIALLAVTGFLCLAFRTVLAWRRSNASWSVRAAVELSASGVPPLFTTSWLYLSLFPKQTSLVAAILSTGCCISYCSFIIARACAILLIVA